MRLATLCAQSEQAEGDLRKKLHDWGLSPTDTHHIIALLKQERYLNNERYARAYCRDKLRFNGWGRIKLAFMLKGKGIEPGYKSLAFRVNLQAADHTLTDEEIQRFMKKIIKVMEREFEAKLRD